MQIAPKFFITLIMAAFFTACSAGSDANSNSNTSNQPVNSANSNNAVNDEIEELELTVKLPFHPEEAVWREETLGKPGTDRVPGPTDKKLVAVLRFLKDDAEKVAAMAEKHRPVLNETLTTETWYPAELIAQSRTSGDQTLKGKSYGANDFYNVPYMDGKITRIEGTDYFILELYAK
jgi:hypothetical protein